MAHHLVAQELQPGRTDLVQRAELAALVPPFGGKPREAVDLVRIECRR
jgi:hypothetical protein